ncbi:class I SAM-dependent methyltransferase [Saccharothrix saharensis]|uniref:class I SAM-dependent methyltransferase n=1 Tax=Saccharothrix saharensis TaxID=571190 RepID=UPI0011517BF6|nr:class I SAM-dependent methyltransferase [Saccharothrix saharensis]
MTEATRQRRAWQQAPWGRLRCTRANATLARHLPSPPATVLDLAGGDGADALRVARQGHEVTVLDRSAGMPAEAERAFADAGLPVRPDLADLPGAAPGPYDVVPAHNVIQHRPDPVVACARPSTSSRPAGCCR